MVRKFGNDFGLFHWLCVHHCCQQVTGPQPSRDIAQEPELFLARDRVNVRRRVR